MTGFRESSTGLGAVARNGGAIQKVVIKKPEHFRVRIGKDELAIFFISRGKLQFRDRNQSYQFENGCGLIVNQFGLPGLSTEGEGVDGVAIKVGMETIQKLLSLIEYRPNEFPVVTTHNQLLFPKSEGISLFLKSMRLYGGSYDSFVPDSICESKILELFWILNSDVKNDFDRLIHPFLVPNRIFLDSIVERYYKENIGLSQLASAAGYSVSTLKRKFEEIYNCPPGRWVQNRRLAEARFLLEATNKTIYEIAYEVGFETTSHFIQAFKMKFGTTPKKLQQRKNVA